MSRPAFNDFSTAFSPEASGVAIAGTTLTTSVTTDRFGTDRYSAIIVYLEIGAVSGTLDVKLRTVMPDGSLVGTGGTGIEIAAATQITGSGKSGFGFVGSGNAVFTTASLSAGTFKTLPLGQMCDILLTVSGGGSIVVTRFDVILIR